MNNLKSTTMKKQRSIKKITLTSLLASAVLLCAFHAHNTAYAAQSDLTVAVESSNSLSITPKLLTNTDIVALHPNVQITLKITNHAKAGSVPIKRVRLDIPENLAKQIDIQYHPSCDLLPPNGSCEVTLMPKEGIQVTKLPVRIAIQGQNLKPAFFKLNVMPPLKACAGSYWYDKKEWCLIRESFIITDKSKNKLSLNIHKTGENPMFLDANNTWSAQPQHFKVIAPLAGTSIIDGNSQESGTCIDKDMGQYWTCPFHLSVVDNAPIGEYKVRLLYTAAGNYYQDFIFYIQPAASDILVNNSASNIVVEPGKDVMLTVTNNSNFAWTNKGAHKELNNVTFANLNNAVSIISNKCSGTINGKKHAPDNTCEIHLKIDNVEASNLGNLVFYGDGPSMNGHAPYTRDLVLNHSVVATPDTSKENKHLGDIAFIVNNYSSSNTYLQKIDFGTLAGNVEFCDADNKNCDNHSSCVLSPGEKSGTGIAPSGHCTIWLHAKNGPVSNSVAKTSALSLTFSDQKGTPIKTSKFNLSYKNSLYAAGNFNKIGETATGYIASWDGKSWDTLEAGLDGTIEKLFAFKGDVYAAGQFTKTSDKNLSAVGLARWDGKEWSDVSKQTFSRTHGKAVTIQALSSINDKLVVGGDFNQIGTLPANGIAIWDGTSWQTPGNGVSLKDADSVMALAPLFPYIYVGGSFNEVDNIIAANNFARTNTASFQGNDVLDSGVSKGGINTLLSNMNQLYVGGDFMLAGTTGNDVFNRHKLAMWDGKAWLQVGGGVSCARPNPDKHCSAGDSVNALTINNKTGSIYVAGSFQKVNNGTIAANNIAIWDVKSNKWLTLGKGLDNTVYTLLYDEGTLYAGGAFISANGNTNIKYIAKNVGGKWENISSSTPNGAVFSMIDAPSLTITAAENSK